MPLAESKILLNQWLPRTPNLAGTDDVADILSLSKARKAKAHDAKQSEAAANRVKFGRTKAEKAADKAGKDAAQKSIDGHKREP
jgi:hypothetical protein